MLFIHLYYFHLMRKLTIDISPEQHEQIKIRADHSGQSINEYVIDRLLPDADDESDWQAFKEVMGARVDEALKTTPIHTTFRAALDEKLNSIRK